MRRILVRQNRVWPIWPTETMAVSGRSTRSCRLTLTLPPMSNRLTVFLLRRSQRCSPAPSAHLHRYFVVSDLSWRFWPFHHCPPMTSSTPFDDFRTIFGSRFDTDVNLQADHQCVRRCALQPIAGCQPFSCRVQGGVSHLYREEPGARHYRRLFVSTDFEPVGAVDATRTPRCLPAEGLFNVRWSTAATVWFSTRSFDWNCCLASIVWHPAGDRPW